jgi:DNA repair protein RadC
LALLHNGQGQYSAFPRIAPNRHMERTSCDLRQTQRRNDREAAWAVLINGDLDPVHIMRFPGEPRKVTLPLREIVSAVVETDCRFLLLNHSHCHGDPMPSPEDVIATRMLCRMLSPLRVRLADHVIYAGNRRFSFREEGLL